MSQPAGTLRPLRFGRRIGQSTPCHKRAMSQTLRTGVGTLQLAWKRDLQPLGRAAAVQLLKSAIAGSGGIRPLRRLLAQGTSGLGVDRLDDDAVVEYLAGCIESGQIVALREGDAGGVWAERITETPPAAPEPVLRGVMETTWVEVQLVDLAGEPVANERCRITLTDGTVRETKTNYRGRVKFDGLETPGNCEVTFPDLDTDAWERG